MQSLPTSSPFWQTWQMYLTSGAFWMVRDRLAWCLTTRSISCRGHGWSVTKNSYLCWSRFVRDEMGWDTAYGYFSRSREVEFLLQMATYIDVIWNRCSHRIFSRWLLYPNIRPASAYSPTLRILNCIQAILESRIIQLLVLSLVIWKEAPAYLNDPIHSLSVLHSILLLSRLIKKQ